MTALEQTIAEIESFNGEAFTEVDITHKRFLNYLITMCRIKVLPEQTSNHRKIYQQVKPNDPVVRARRRERIAYYGMTT